MYAGWPQAGPVNEISILASIYVLSISKRFKKKIEKLKDKVKRRCGKIQIAKIW